MYDKYHDIFQEPFIANIEHCAIPWYYNCIVFNHMTKKQELLTSFKLITSNGNITTNGATLSIFCKRIATIDSKTLTNVLYVPHLRKNLIFVKKVANARFNLTFLFSLYD